jgi:CBS domain-containing protein
LPAPGASVIVRGELSVEGGNVRVEDMLNTKGRRVSTIRPDASVLNAVLQMRREGIGALVVTGDGERVEGVLSERDVVRALTTHRQAALDRLIRDVMSHPVVTCAPDDTVKWVMEQMTRLRVRHLPVVEAGRLAGIVSIGDVVKSRLDELELEGTVLRQAYIARH